MHSVRSQYVASAVATVGPARLLTMLYDRMLLDVDRAVTCFRSGQRVDGTQHLVHAQEIVAECERRGLLADAICVTQHAAVTFVRRLTRDLREHRKPPWVLVRRGLHLARLQGRVVARAVAAGCRPMTPERAYAEQWAFFLRAPER